MSVTNYKPKTDSGCTYNYSKLNKVVYLVSKDAVKNVHIDDGEAYIDGLSEVPMRIDGFNINLEENSSLDERYKFQKSVTFSVHGYVPHVYFDNKYYVILESNDGTNWMVNVDFPSKVTYTFHLDSASYQTDLTFSSLSNFPTLRLASEFEKSQAVCIGYSMSLGGVKSLQLLEKDYCSLDTRLSKVYTYGEDFKDIEFLGNTCSLEETFNGEKLTTTIEFEIAFDAYKSSWHYNLLEFLQNLYSAIIIPKGSDNTFFSGFNHGLQPSFKVATNSQDGESDVITITLTESSSQGSVTADSWSPEDDPSKMWIFIEIIDGIEAYECIGKGVAKYLLQQEINGNGVPTGRYKVLEGYESRFPNLNIIGTFSEIVTFQNSKCTSVLCQVNTDMPNTIVYNEATCYSYSYSASCDWNVNGLASYMAVSPMNGVAGVEYTITVCNSKTPTKNETSVFNISAGDNIKVVNVFLYNGSNILNPQIQHINCLKQNVIFTFDHSCPITVISINPELTYTINNSQLIVTVPRNNSITNIIEWEIEVKDCHNNTQTVIISQDKTYERWVDTSGYLCDDTTSYVKQQRYTGTTSYNTTTPTDEYRHGAKIKDNDVRCGASESRWSFLDHYYCIDGDKYKAEEEEVSYDGGITWTKTGVTRLGEMVEADSSFCDESLNPVTYEWRLTRKWQCLSTD